MHASALSQIVEYLAMFEGGGKKNPITWMYLDTRGLVTTGVGLLLDPFPVFGKKVTFYQKDGDGKAGDVAAGDAALKSEFDMVKGYTEDDPNKQGEKRPKAGFKDYHAFEPITQLRIKESATSGSSLKSVQGIDAVLKKDFGGDYETWPADVQVAVVQMAYAGGLEARKKDGLFKLLKDRDWFNAQEYAYLSNPQSGRKGYVTYNRALPALMMNGWIIDQCRKIKMRTPAPTDHTTFYGVKNKLWVARWSKETMDPEIRPDDVITGGDYSKMCMAQ